ncbi:3' terminal RNA ribose 2'-O-methyltransferase Hen1 [Kineococcus xinjiangensis]|uniref:Small RNA 2'-O-methyltransferase n=1 Tax=Kineococcus xinjiangensis TaxID=512762 RepID=A0A2S6IX51_9ACTN|nr:3' terminal RNA ribose 2'-O-methyltransferase Hen1 [Kineococcus xinjiangensis]PPK98731.1 3' terminal RNA ribose 2'-O-methyltransferase Hen1 [Kineococcus xinjiangensis]
MLLTLTTTGTPERPATDLGHLLHKHPDRPQATPLASGTAHVVYPEATPERCTAALLLEVDPVALVRGARGGEGFALHQHVNDRPYAASSLLAVAIASVFRTALAGRCTSRPALAAAALPLQVRLPVLPCRGGPDGGAELVRRLFAPLGWDVDARELPLDEEVPSWGASPYVDLRLRGTVRLADALSHLYVLLPVLDDAKHYWVGAEEVEKLLRVGSGWLETHPERELISHRYLARQRSLASEALDLLGGGDDPDALGEAAVLRAAEEAAAAVARPSLAAQRRAVVVELLRQAGARRVADLGCGEGALVAELLADPAFTRIVAADVSSRALAGAERRLRLDRMPQRQRERLALLQTSLTYRDDRLAGLDAAVLVEVVEHVEPSRLPALQRSVFAFTAPRTVVVTTPNAEHNVRFPSLPAGRFRHPDHRFEWTREEFRRWAADVAGQHGYGVRFAGAGPDDPEVGPPTQIAVFTRDGGDAA